MFVYFFLKKSTIPCRYSSRGSEYYRGANRFEYRPPRRDIDDTRGRTDYKRGVDFYQNFPNQLNMGAPVQQKYGKKRFRGDDAFYIDAPIVDEPPKNGQLIAHSHDRNDDVTVQVFEFGTNKERCKCITQGFIRNPWNGIFDPAKAAPRTAQKRSRSPETKDTYFRNRTLYDRQSNIVTYIYHQKSQDPKTNGNYVTIRQQVRGPPDSTHLYYTEPVEEINSERLHEIKPGNPRFESRIKSKSIAQTEPRPTPNPTVRRSPSPEHSQPMERPTKRARTMDAHEPTSLETFEKVKFQVPNSPKRNESVAQVDPTPRNANILAQLLNMLDPTPESFAILKQVADKLKK